MELVLAFVALLSNDHVFFNWREFTRLFKRGFLGSNENSLANESNRKPMKGKKNYNSSVITRSTSCVNSKLEAISQKIMFKGKEQKIQRQSNQQTGLIFENDSVKQKLQNAQKEDFEVTEKFRYDPRTNLAQSSPKLEEKDISRVLDNTHITFAPQDLTECSEKIKSDSSSRLLRRRHTTYIKEQGRSKSALSILERTNLKNTYEHFSNDQDMLSASLNRSILREDADIVNLGNNWSEDNLKNQSDIGSFQSSHSWHRFHGYENDSSQNHYDIQKVR